MQRTQQYCLCLLVLVTASCVGQSQKYWFLVLDGYGKHSFTVTLSLTVKTWHAAWILKCTQVHVLESALSLSLSCRLGPEVHSRSPTLFKLSDTMWLAA